MNDSARDWAKRMRPVFFKDYPDLPYSKTLLISEWHELANLLDLYADHLDSLASRGRLGGLKTASSMSVAERKARARKGGLASRKAKDPTPWCHQCGARKPESCKCGPHDPMN